MPHAAARTRHSNVRVAAEDAVEIRAQRGGERLGDACGRATAKEAVKTCFHRRSRFVIEQSLHLGHAGRGKPRRVAIRLRREESEAVAAQFEVAGRTLLAAFVVLAGGAQDVRTTESHRAATALAARARNFGVQDVPARRAHVFREDLSRHMPSRILGHGKQVKAFFLEVEGPSASLGARPRGHMERESDEEKFEFFIDPAAEDHAGLSKVQIKIHEHGTEVRRAEQRVASPQSSPLFHQVTEGLASFRHRSKPSNTGAMPEKSRGFGGWPPSTPKVFLFVHLLS